MLATKYFFCTLKNFNASEDNISNKLMLRSGMIRKLSSGIYVWLPTGLRVLNKIKNIIREEMIKTKSIEISMPIIQSSDLWKLSNRWQEYGSDLFRLTDRNNHLFIISPTNEEMIAYIIKNEIRSYKDLPINLFQIQTKFRDEIRPRCGVIRAREFIMKDGYSFHNNENSLKKTYESMYDAYIKIFKRIGLDFKIVKADAGKMGGKISHEFQVICNNGEDEIAFSNKSNFASNVSLVKINKTLLKRKKAKQKIILMHAPGINSTIDLIMKLNLPAKKIIKILLVKSNENNKLIAILLRGDHTLNIKKIEKIPFIAKPLTLASKEEIYKLTGIKSSLLGPVDLKLTIVSDYSVLNMSDFIAGANIDEKYFLGINWKRDLPEPSFVFDIRNVTSGDPSPDGKGKIIIKKSIEIAHIFQLGNKYSKLIGCLIQNKEGDNKEISMGCYGIGVTRMIAAIIEQNNDKDGIIWPSDEISPFTISIVPVNMYISLKVKHFSEYLYKKLSLKGIDVILDDRKKSFGFMIKDMELIGIPHIFIVSDNNIKNNIIEYKKRGDKIYKISSNDILNFIELNILK